MSQREQQLLLDIKRLQSANAELRVQLAGKSSGAKAVPQDVKRLEAKVADLRTRLQAASSKPDRVVYRDVEKVTRMDTVATEAMVSELQGRISILERELAGLERG